MRSRKNPYHRKRRKTNPKLLVGFFVAFLMVTSIFGFIMGESGSDYSYGDFKFVRSDFGYSTKIDGQDILFFNLPEAVEQVEVSQEVVDKLKDSFVFTVTYDPDSDMAETLAAVQFNFQQSFQDKFVQIGLTDNTDYPSIMQADCTNATSKVPVVLFKTSNTTSIELNDDCIVVNSDTAVGFQRLHDRLLYGVLGIL